MSEINESTVLNTTASESKAATEPEKYQFMQCGRCGGQLFQERVAIRLATEEEKRTSPLQKMYPLVVYICSLCETVFQGEPN